MIKINKNLSNIPTSLKPATAEFFPLPRQPYITSRKTHIRRIALINDGHYTDHANYNNRYKVKDVKNALDQLYHGKCAFCETKIEQSHVEHYRPKSIYYWLAYSWDNLILACATCNQHKRQQFELEGVPQVFVNNPNNIRDINRLSANYDLLESPKMVNPEVTDPLGQITFTRLGVIESQNPRFAYTITACKLERPTLNLGRKQLLDLFKKNVISILTKEKTKHNQLIKIEAIIQKFIEDTKESDEQFLAFRKFALHKNWLAHIVMELN